MAVIFVCAVDVSYSSMAAWAYVIMGGFWLPLLCWGGMFAVVFCVATPACGSDISRRRIHLPWILSLCSSCAVSVNWCSSVLVLVVFLVS
jgi:hypothetical protein